MLKDRRFANNQMRVQHRKALADVLKEKIQEFDRKELLNTFIEENIPAGAVKSIAEVFDATAIRERILREEKENEQLFSVEGNAFIFSD